MTDELLQEEVMKQFALAKRDLILKKEKLERELVKIDDRIENLTIESFAEDYLMNTATYHYYKNL